MSYKNDIPIQSWAEDDKPVTKILMKGKLALSDAELLSIVIGNNGSKSHSGLDLARSLLHQAENHLGLIARMSVTELIKSGKITQSQAIRIMATFEIGRRRDESETVGRRKVINSTTAYEAFKTCLSDKAYEEFWVILLNRSNCIIGLKLISEGGVSGTVVDPKKIFKIALDHYACGIILGHNHPSGTVVPSDSDQKITGKLLDDGKLLEISVLDHIILGDNDFYSFSDNGDL